METNTVKLKNGRKLGFVEYGDPRGKPILYFHGFPGSRLEAHHLHQSALSNGCRVLAIDRPGMGLSSMDNSRSILAWADDVTEFLNYLDLVKCAIMGHSGGAPFVAACAYAIPDRISRLAIVSGMAPFKYPEASIGLARGQQFANKLIMHIPYLANLMMALTRMMLKRPSKMMEQLLKQLPEIDQKLFLDPDVGKMIIDSTIEAFQKGLSGPAKEIKLVLKPWGFDLEDIRCSVDIWHGTVDSQVPLSHAKIYGSKIPGASLNIIENEGHHSLIRNYSDSILKGVAVS